MPVASQFGLSRWLDLILMLINFFIHRNPAKGAKIYTGTKEQLPFYVTGNRK